MLALDADKDGQVAPAELKPYYLKNGLAPFQFQLDPPAGNPLGAVAALLGGGRSEPPVTAVSEAAFALVDADRDGKVTREELAGASAALLRLDENEDEVVTTVELVSDQKPSSSPIDLAQMMAGGGRTSSSGGNKFLVPIMTPGKVPASLVRFLQERVWRQGGGQVEP